MIKVGQFVVALVFIIAMLSCGNDYARAFEIGALWGFWITLISALIAIVYGLLITHIPVVSKRRLAKINGTEVKDKKIKRWIKAGFVLIVILLSVISTLRGYHLIREWAQSDFLYDASLAWGAFSLSVGFVLMSFTDYISTQQNKQTKKIQIVN